MGDNAESTAEDTVQEALTAGDYAGMREFLLAQTGKTLTEMAAILDVSTQTFIAVHNKWVENNAPPLWED